MRHGVQETWFGVWSGFFFSAWIYLLLGVLVVISVTGASVGGGVFYIEENTVGRYI